MSHFSWLECRGIRLIRYKQRKSQFGPLRLPRVRYIKVDGTVPDHTSRSLIHQYPNLVNFQPYLPYNKKNTHLYDEAQIVATFCTMLLVDDNRKQIVPKSKQKLPFLF